MRYPLILTLSILLASCTGRGQEHYDPLPNLCQHTSLLHLSETREGYTLAQILNPWRPTKVEVQYLLVPAADTHWNEETAQRATKKYGSFTLLRTPLQRITLTAACHAFLLDELRALDHVSVMCDTEYVHSPAVHRWMHDGLAFDGGSSMAPNPEILLAAQTNAVWISPYENASAGNIAHLPLTLIYCADYMETSPLARSEWMRFYGRLVGKGQEADSLFLCISARYDSLTSLSHADRLTSLSPDTLQAQRSLLAELPYGPTWYVPGGQSTSAQLYHDAGYAYPWADDPHAGSLSLSPEAVLAKAADCDRWLFKYMNTDGDWTLSDFLAQNPLYGQFCSAQTGNVWGCNTSYSDFFDVTPFRPDMLLESLINDDERFFKKLK